MSRNRELEIEPDASFDYDEWEEHLPPAEEHKDPYEDYEPFDVEVCEIVTKNVTVFAKDKKSAKEYVSDCLEHIDMRNDIDDYMKIVTVAHPSESECEMTVPLWWYGKENEG